ncbi:uncharacterized protein EKO05_0006031 [Ascochyta rabiei]|uniref:uncharacterized protein n=1 Tax=Didymella rabiei TaxID=5454 RepID=UPI00190126F5|nr:uncharacterized protein EKO05_0006031 [Ascochyta rabiei]UPX15587.1 hypothetical protein EKO05_0006031 [Ascochyta rabiei]
MAQATLEDSVSREQAPSVAFIIARNGDPLTLALRHEEELSSNDVLQLSRAFSSVSTSIGFSPTTVFSSCEPSIATKPTSYGTNYPANKRNGEGKTDITYAASLSATYGSEFDGVLEHDDVRHTALLGVGAWSSSPQAHDQCLRRLENTRPRISRFLPGRVKKPLIVIHQSHQAAASACHEELSTVAAPARAEAGRTCPRHRIPQQHYALLGIVGLMVLTIIWSILSVYCMDKANMPLIRRTIFAATLLMALETVATMLVARRTLLESLLLGLFSLIAGFELLLHLDQLI